MGRHSGPRPLTARLSLIIILRPRAQTEEVDKHETGADDEANSESEGHPHIQFSIGRIRLDILHNHFVRNRRARMASGILQLWRY